MGIEKVFSGIALSGRKTISYLLTDPFGGSCLVTGSYITNTSPRIAYPLIIFGLYHTTRMTINRIRLDILIRKHGWNERIIEKFSGASLCSNIMLRAYLWGSRKYSEFKETIEKHNISHLIINAIKII